MRVIGYGFTGPSTVNLAADNRYLSLAEVGQTVYVPKLVAKLDGLGSGGGVQFLRGVIHNADDNSLIAVGEEIELADMAQAAWVDLPFEDSGGVLLDPASYWLEVHAGGVDQVGRLYYDTSAGTRRSGVSDTYADGPAATPGGSNATGRLSLYAPFVTEWTPPDPEELAWYARLPFVEAQAWLSQTGADRDRQHPHSASCGWHGTKLDPETGSFAIVRTGSAMADLVGDKIALTYRNRTVYAYVHREADILEDVSLSRRTFLTLAPLAFYEITPTVEVLA